MPTTKLTNQTPCIDTTRIRTKCQSVFDQEHYTMRTQSVYGAKS